MNKYMFGAELNDMDDNVARPSALPNQMVLAMSYMPMQFYDTMFEVEECFSCGSIFPELIKPFTGCDPR